MNPIARAALSLGAVACAIACTLHSSGCTDQRSHVYLGRLYVEARDCVGTTSSVDVVDGEPAATSCAPVCILERRPEGGRVLYVSTMCAPLPSFGFDNSGTDPKCPQAIAAFLRDDTCLSDGGTTKPVVEGGVEAGPAEAGSDAGTEDSGAGDASSDQ